MMFGTKQIQEVLNKAGLTDCYGLPDVGHLVYIKVKVADILSGRCSAPTIQQIFKDAGYNIVYSDNMIAKCNAEQRFRNPNLKWLAFKLV